MKRHPFRVSAYFLSVACAALVAFLLLAAPAAFARGGQLLSLEAAPVIAGQEFFLDDAGSEFWQQSPDISGRWVIWSQSDYWGRESLFLYDLQTGAKTLVRQTAPNVILSEYAVSPTTIVWQEAQVHTYNIATKEEKVTSITSTFADPAISGSHIVYTVNHGNGSFGVWLYDIDTDQTRPLCDIPGNQAGSPKIAGDTVVWKDNRNAGIYLYDLSLGQERPLVTPDAGGLLVPVGISDGQVVFQDWGGGSGGNVTAYDLTTGERRLIAQYGGASDVADEKIICVESTAEGTKLMLHGLFNGVEQQIAPDAVSAGVSLSGNTVVWRDIRSSGNGGDIFAYSGDYVEHAPPVTTFDGPVPDTTYPHNWDWSRLPFTLLFTAVDPQPGSGLAYIESRIDGGDWVQGNERVIPAPLDHSNDGPHTVSYRSADQLGNVEGERTFPFSLNIDTRRPTAKAPYAATARRGGTAALKYKVVDARPGSPKTTVKIVVKNRASKVMKTLSPVAKPVNTLMTWKFTVPRTWRAGTYRFYVYALRDSAGNIGIGPASNKLIVR